MSVLFTIGYEGTDIDRFIKTLKEVGVQQLVDVRAVTVSRKKGFSKRGLAARLEEEGISYLHLVDLGDPKPGREAARAGKMEEFRRIYTAHLSGQEAQAALHELTLYAALRATCLLCYERNPVECHRSIVAAEVCEALGWEQFPLYADDPSRYVRNSKDLPRFYPRQGVAAAE
ncbi:DUF488 family protein [Paenirhodobacter sp.]|uniref:DUF488 domain-containing protein n=1 Tax=Paenirhodobacter sp. TaxID=1965326 RepID=UPI003B5051B5